ncbi:tRNA lysidine(34) synthetase TilS [Chryseobacterium sp. L7]|uniref:tRNA(Ile)-lysidine synthase n=1 Tax=Chryseobacterium endalhagicum TaxID=2797638 RepID=A0ABS1Q9L1_9FLAO|nr:tRNA lysidine(34) synthetase TilS [Chryseobacterium endalhagicum]MBL1219290.1 tRNA lysidine(34) synthetase TilS [Chryseobacterium endalhagicum]
MENISFKNQLENLVRNPENHTYLLAVSGGADSMVLASLFQGLGIVYQVAHINYKLRGEDADLDQKTVQDFCEKNHIPFHLYEVSEKDKKPENSIQLWARELRYRFFKEIREREKLEFLVTAHHLNDQLETFIINLSKASGINGLSGIPAASNQILRPLLHFSKEEIYQYAEKHKIDFREDLSNKKNDYLRNKIRNEIVPRLLETNDHFLENFKKSSDYLNQTKDFVQKQIESIENSISTFNLGEKIISKEKLNKESDFVKFEILKKYGFKNEEEIKKIFSAQSGSQFISNDYLLIISRNELLLSKKNDRKDIEEDIVLTENFEFSNDEVNISLENVIENIEGINNSFEWHFDPAKLQFPLRLRKQQDGDEFYPAGFSGKKKVSKFFRDEKLSILARQKIWILCDGSNSILGVVPLRQDRRYTKDEKTKSILKIFNEKNNEI